MYIYIYIHISVCKTQIRHQQRGCYWSILGAFLGIFSKTLIFFPLIVSKLLVCQTGYQLLALHSSDISYLLVHCYFRRKKQWLADIWSPRSVVGWMAGKTALKQQQQGRRIADGSTERMWRLAYTGKLFHC